MQKKTWSSHQKFYLGRNKPIKKINFRQQLTPPSPAATAAAAYQQRLTALSLKKTTRKLSLVVQNMKHSFSPPLLLYLRNQLLPVKRLKAKKKKRK